MNSPRDARRFLYVLVAFAVAVSVVVSAALAVPPGDRGKPAGTSSQPSAASDDPAKKCRAERSAGPAGFAERYGTHPNKRNAFGKCVSSRAKKSKEDDEDDEISKDESEGKRDNAAKKCKAELASRGAAAFAERYGTNPNKRNAFGKCVSKYAKEQAKKPAGG